MQILSNYKKRKRKPGLFNFILLIPIGNSPMIRVFFLLLQIIFVSAVSLAQDSSHGNISLDTILYELRNEIQAAAQSDSLNGSISVLQSTIKVNITTAFCAMTIRVKQTCISTTNIYFKN
jgi:hypothetical protein